MIGSRTQRMLGWMKAAIAARERSGVPDWTNGLLKPYRPEAA